MTEAEIKEAKHFGYLLASLATPEALSVALRAAANALWDKASKGVSPIGDVKGGQRHREMAIMCELGANWTFEK